MRLPTSTCAELFEELTIPLDVLESTEILCFLWSDAAEYMIAAGAILKFPYPKLFYMTCTAHSLHNCAMKVKCHFEDVDHLIAKVKLATVKNKIRRAKFVTIGCPLHPILP